MFFFQFNSEIATLGRKVQLMFHTSVEKLLPYIEILQVTQKAASPVQAPKSKTRKVATSTKDPSVRFRLRLY